ncbi:MAG: NUDIX domain-containing protein [Propionibacteriaceae bacterium]|jgi:8-oxo-dGTP pyrophosphatase MutT (NUDIX family)|nr:NUDIX domain-containing protein [Propionibacteriaceae bacterium]
MRIAGVLAPGGPAEFTFDLPHGGDPYRMAWERGFRILRPLSTSGVQPDLEMIVQVATHSRRVARPHFVTRTIEDGLPDDIPVPRQRIAAYGIITSRMGLLATQFSELTAVPGLWGLPGGGIHDGETPSQALVREVAEETGQGLGLLQLLDLQTDHWIGRSPTGVIEDFHAVRIIYTGICPAPIELQVNDAGGTTAAATWVPLNDWQSRNWTQGTRALLDRHIPVWR